MQEPHRYRLIKLRGGSVLDDREDLHLLTAPAVGRRLVMYRSRSNRRIVTSPVVRMYQDTTAWGTYFETRNSVYLLQVDPR